MTENKINPLLDAMSEIDDNIITTTKKSKKRPLMIVAAAAVATTLLLTGAAVIRISEVTINNKHLIDYNFTVQENVNTDPHQELLEMGATSQPLHAGGTAYNLTALPSEVFEVLNIDPLMNDNFTEKESEIEVILLEYGQPSVPGYLHVIYSLTDRKTGVEMRFHTYYKLIEEVETKAEYQNLEEYELLDLNDGSKALIYGYGYFKGTFSYGGIIYDFTTGCTDYDNVIKTLTDLGIL